MRLNPAFRPSISMNFTAAPVRGCAPKLLSVEAISKPFRDPATHLRIGAIGAGETPRRCARLRIEIFL